MSQMTLRRVKTVEAIKKLTVIKCGSQQITVECATTKTTYHITC